MIYAKAAKQSFFKFQDPFKMNQRSEVLGVGISPLNLETASEILMTSSLEPGFCGYVTVTGVHGVMESQKDPELLAIHNASFLSVPDGMPMVWIGKWNGFQDIGRVYGPDLMLRIFEGTELSQQSHFLFGGGDDVVNQLERGLLSKYPKSSIVGKITPPFRPLTDEEENDLVGTLRKTRPHFFWVGLSTPKQERFMHAFLTKYPDLTKDWDHGMIMLGVGAAFDFHAGLVPQAPKWMQNCGLEWLFRMIKEPKRLWRRYVYNNPRFICKIIYQMRTAP
jgi:N-acetylglucosaminyldiphosphoundecaprenol N-acetyl-beta-D-mannosaminyltransferase